jgi:hypothetical protein
VPKKNAPQITGEIVAQTQKADIAREIRDKQP